MAEEIVQLIVDPGGQRRVMIVRRDDGRFTYRWQERQSGDWGGASIDAGVYDTLETAEAEARQRVSWLKNLFH